MHEILHLSFGAKSNHLTSHFFNAQESYFTYGKDVPSPVDHDISFRTGLANDGSGRDTYTPRCLLWDFRGGRGSLKTYNDYYNEGEGEKSVWDESQSQDAEMLQQPPVKRSKYHDYLDGLVKVNPNQLEPILSADDINYWTDYSHLFYHPRSMRQVQNWEYVPKSDGSGYRSVPRGVSIDSKNEDKLPEFRGIENGIAEWRNENEEIDQMDTYFRPFLEECDLLQGINILCDFDTAWAGFSSQALAAIYDEYLNKPVVTVWQVLDPNPEDIGASPTEIDRTRKLIDRLDAECEFSEITEGSSTLFVDLGMPSRTCLSKFFKQSSVAQNFDYNSLWQTSAIQCLAFENQTFPTRLTSNVGRIPMGDLISPSLLSSPNRSDLRRVSSVDLAVLDGGLISLSENMAEWNAVADRCLPVRQRGPGTVKGLSSSSAYVFGRSGLVRGGLSLNDVDEIWSKYSQEWVDSAQMEVQEDAAGNNKFSDFEPHRLLTSEACEATLHRFGYPYLDSFPNLFPQLDRMRLEGDNIPSAQERQREQINHLYTDFTLNTDTRRLYQFKLAVAKARVHDTDKKAALVDYLSGVASEYARSLDMSSDSDEEMSD